MSTRNSSRFDAARDPLHVLNAARTPGFDDPVRPDLDFAAALRDRAREEGFQIVTDADGNVIVPAKTDVTAEVVDTLVAAGIAEDLFIWAGCEFDAFKDIRRSVRKDLKVAKDRHLVAAYWRRGAAGDEARRGARGED
mgnify:CR=1 FL=1